MVLGSKDDFCLRKVKPSLFDYVVPDVRASIKNKFS